MTYATTAIKAYVCRAYGDYHNLVIEYLSLPAPGADEILIENHAFGIGFPDLLIVQGRYQHRPPLPFTPGAECSGRVLAIGARVCGFALGDRVMATARTGAYAEAVIVRAEECFKLPEPFDFAAGAAYLTAYKTAYVALVVRGGLRAGETLLVQGAAGGVGLAAVALGKLLGATVIATAGSPEKLAVVAATGADHVINYRESSFREQVKTLTGGRGADVIFDPVGGEVFDESLRCIAPFGRMLVIGFASGRIPTVAANHVLIKQYAVIGVRAGEYGRLDPAGGRRVTAALLDFANSSALRPYIHRRLPFAAVVQAFDEIAARKVIGRIVIEVER